MNCKCCGTLLRVGPVRVDGGLMHFECWEEHHSDPTGAWPFDHACAGGAMTDDYTPTVEELIATYAIASPNRGMSVPARDAAARRALAAHDAAKRAEWEADRGRQLCAIEKFLSDAEDVGQVTDPAEKFGTPAERAAGAIDRAWRAGLRQILSPVTNTESEGTDD